MNKFILLCLFSIITSFGYAQTTFALWQGFSNNWTYNHRVNRIGDYISHAKNDKGNVLAVHTAATGLGKDSAYFTSYYATIKSENINCFAGKSTIEIKSEEGKLKTTKKNIVLYPDSLMKSKDNYIALLNGFDLISKDDADKFKHFSVSISQPKYNAQNNELTFSIESKLQMDCSSLECSWLHQTFNYKLDIYYIILAGDSSAVAYREMDYQREITWNTDSQIPLVPLEKSVSITPGYNSGFFGYQSFSLKLDDEQHYLGYENAITGTMINPLNLSATCMMQLYFSNCKENMRKSPASGGQSFFAYAKKGSAELNGKLLFVQFNGQVNYGKQEGSIFWQGKNKSPESDAAVKKFAVPLR